MRRRQVADALAGAVDSYHQHRRKLFVVRGEVFHHARDHRHVVLFEQIEDGIGGKHVSADIVRVVDGELAVLAEDLRMDHEYVGHDIGCWLAVLCQGAGAAEERKQGRPEKME